MFDKWLQLLAEGFFYRMLLNFSGVVDTEI